MTLSVLIVDDEFGLAEISADLLREAGYDVELAMDGRAALDAFAARPFDLVLTDLMMPVMDGVALIAALKSDPKTAHVPCVLMTALPEGIPADGSSRHDALLVKPYSVKELMQLVTRLLAPPS